jgi:exportin-2 (importin alpha re-exporter)
MKVNGVPMFTPAEFSPFALPLLTQLFSLIKLGKTPEKLAENDYLMKCTDGLRQVFSRR